MTVHCVHSPFRRAAASLWRRLTGRTWGHPKVVGLCPICGLLPKGDRMVEYVLTVWFWDGTVLEFRFRGRSPKHCYRVSNNTLTIFKRGSTVIYNMDNISTVDFAIREVSESTTPVSPEVAEAERIISGRNEDE